MPSRQQTFGDLRGSGRSKRMLVEDPVPVQERLSLLRRAKTLVEAGGGAAASTKSGE